VPARSSSASRVRTFMQGRTRPEPVLCEVMPPPIESSSLQGRKSSTLILGMSTLLHGTLATPCSSSSPSTGAAVLDTTGAARAGASSPSLMLAVR
jgi:hypothetical protein